MSIDDKNIQDNHLHLLKEEADRVHNQRIGAAKIWKKENPEEWQKWFDGIKQRNQEDVIEGFLNGWWELDDNGNMVSPAIVVDTAELPEGAIMAHVMAKVGIFPSVNQARKNGWDKPIEKGIVTVTKKKIRINII